MGEASKPGGSLSMVPGCRLLNVEPQTTVLKAIQLMAQAQTGAVVVTMENRCVGIFTAWDLLQFQAREPGSDLSSVHLGDVMTNKVISARPADALMETVPLMLKSGIGYLPVMAEHCPAKMLRLVDILAYRYEVAEKKLAYLEGYLSDLMNAETD